MTLTQAVLESLCQAPDKIISRDADSAVIGEPDGDRGEAVVAFVSPTDTTPTAEQLREFCRERPAELKAPRRITVARDLPRGPTGKLLKRALRDWTA